MYSRKLALSLAKQCRTCPPPDIRDDPSYKENIEKHLDICPYCSTQEIEDTKPWEDLTTRLQHLFSSSHVSPDQDSVRCGQLRYVRSDMGRWCHGLFYNAPVVLVLESNGAISDDILVAQTYHDIYLAAPGDLILTDQQTGMGDLFVECWNTYTLRAANLGPLLGEVGPEIVQAVKDMEENSEAYPDWAVYPGPLRDHDPRIYFRELEVEVGYTFALQAVQTLMAELEKPLLRILYSSTKEVQDSIKKRAPGIKWLRKPGTIQEALATAQFPPEQYAKAAADDDIETVPANLVLLQGGRIKSFEPIQSKIFQKEIVAGGVAIGGRILGIPAGVSGSEFVCLLRSQEEGLVAPESIRWEEGSGSFLAKFKTEGDVDAKLEIAVLFELSEK